jgi:hypothetical protein
MAHDLRIVSTLCLFSVLTGYIDQLTLGRTNCRIFMPLCGDNIDMKWCVCVCLCVTVAVYVLV